jgi:hypothetical protein
MRASPFLSLSAALLLLPAAALAQTADAEGETIGLVPFLLIAFGIFVLVVLIQTLLPEAKTRPWDRFRRRNPAEDEAAERPGGDGKLPPMRTKGGKR